MDRRISIFNQIITYVLTAVVFLLVVFVGGDGRGEFWTLFFLLILGSIISGLFFTFLHELGHVLVGKKNGFEFISACVFCIKVAKIKGKKVISLCVPADELGYSEMLPTTEENIEERYSKMAFGPFWPCLIACVLGILPLFMTFLPGWLYCLWASLFPMGVYFLLDNFLPAVRDGEKNDGAVIYSFKKKTDSAKVMANLLKIQAQIYQGKTPCEIESSLYFDLPQLPEDDPVFFRLLLAKYDYYLDVEDYENLIKITDRLLSLEEYFPDSYNFVAKANQLYNVCAVNYNEDLADDITYEIEDYLNKNKTITNLRIKAAYVLCVNKDKKLFEDFYKKGLKDASNYYIKGVGNFEAKLFQRLKANSLEE